MTFLNFALRYHKDIDHWVIYHLKDVCEMCRRSLNHFSWINVVPFGVVVDVNVNFDTSIAWQRQMCGWLFFRQNVRVVNLSITHDYLVPSSSFNVSMSFGNSNLNLASVIGWYEREACFTKWTLMPNETRSSAYFCLYGMPVFWRARTNHWGRFSAHRSRRSIGEV